MEQSLHSARANFVDARSVTERFPVSEYYEQLDYCKKRELAQQITRATEPMQLAAVDLLRTNRPDLIADENGNIELDIDTLDERTLYKLYQLLCAPSFQSSQPARVYYQTLNFEQKRELSMRLLNATESVKTAGINLIRNMRPDLATVGNEDTVIDVEILDDYTTYHLYQIFYGPPSQSAKPERPKLAAARRNRRDGE
ncbi:hypothetical protein PGTUg99_032580 [Puccinia graminis f. sp. tritici]|uniref:NET domain-containing protein n=1 Tax=Puccinia graminis f. sp. tritici TaxID=56615 RepID=A0A5B0SG70_PUCGR|nr:hypothetical protein PGTUg99_032580 [Puccinia graminis f. sp. tritici]